MTFEGSRRAEKLPLHQRQRFVVTIEDSALRTEMGGLESQEEDAKKEDLVVQSWVFSG